jgi:hypothetical protein
LRNLIAALVPKAFGIEILIPTCRDSGFCALSAFPDMSGCSGHFLEVPLLLSCKKNSFQKYTPLCPESEAEGGGIAALEFFLQKRDKREFFQFRFDFDKLILN